MMKSNPTISYITLALLTVIWSTIVYFDAPKIPYQTAAVADFNNALVAYYSFDDGTGADNSGHGNGGTLSGGSAVVGKVNGAVSFASGGSVAVSKSLYTSYPVTLCAWVKPDLKANGLSSKIIGNSGFDLVMQESDGAEKFIVYNNVNEVLTPYASRYSAGAWHHVCGMVDAGAQASIYVDGALAAGPANLGTASNFWNINIGNNFPGIVDEVRVYNTTLTAGQVSDIYTYTGSPNSVTPPNPDPNPNPNPNPTPDPTPPAVPVVNGLCSLTVNTCTTGTFSDVADTDTEQKWSCTGSGGGTTASCSIPKAPVVPDPNPVIPPDPVPNQPISNEFIPSDRLYDWTNNVGVMGGIPTGRSVCASVKSAPYNAVGDGVTDDTQAIVDAIRACAGKSQAVYFPAGTYKFTSKVIDQGTGRRSTNFTYSNITFRGAGMGKTILKPYMTDVIYVGNGDWPPPAPTVTITGGATRGSNTLTVDNAGSITEGKLITITQTNPNWVHSNDRFYGGGPVDDGHDQTRLMAITVLVKSKSGNTITIDHPLPIDMPNSPMITLWQNIVKNTGFEDMTIDMTNSTGQSGILFNQVYGCWVRGVEIKKPENRFLWFTTVSNCEVRDSYFHDARVTKKEGVDFYQNDTFNLIENNVLVRAGGPMIILGDFGGGVSMNVVAYNYLEDQEGWSDVVPYALSDNHGAHNMFNLFEGNVAQNFSSDGYYGGASHETIFRNRFTSVYGQAPNRNYDYLWQYAIHLGHWAVNYNVVGNVLGSPGYASVYQPSSLNYPGGTKAIYRLGFPDCCNSGYSGTGSNPTNSLTFDTNVEATLVRHGNFDYLSNSVKWAPNISVRSLPVSLYLRGQPSWWNTWGGTAFPPIGPDVSGYAQQIPAQLRYQAILSNRDIAPPEPSIPPPAPNACTSFTYSAWGMCSNNVQSRTILTSSPAGCTGGVPVTTQACSITPVNAVCSNIINKCVAGTFSDTADTVANNVWSCLGSGGGTSLSCSLPKKAEADLLVEKPVALDVVVQKPIPTPQVTPAPITPTPSFISRFIPSFSASKKVSPYTVTANKTPGEFVPIPDVSEDEDVITRAEVSVKETVKTIFSYIAARIVNGFKKVIGRDITLVAPLSNQTAAVADFNSNLVAHYTFDDGTGADASGHSNAGTLAGGASIVGTGKSGQGLDPGSSGRMTLAGDAVGTGDASICMWYYARSLSINGQLVSNGKLGLTVSTNNRFTFSSNGTTQGYTTSGLVTLNTWQHVCVTRDASGVANFYIDASQGGSANQNTGTPVVGDGSLAIGNHSWASHVWDGYIDDVRIYNKVLSASEVQDVYSVLGGSVPVSPPAVPAGANNTPANTSPNNTPANTPPANQNTPAQNVAPASVTAASCNASDVQAAIDAVKDEGIVLVPAGTCSWTTPVNVGTYSFATRKNTSKSVVIKGAGIDQTIILNNLATKSNALTLNIQEGKQVRVTGFTFDGTNTVDNYAEIATYGSPGNPSFRIDHNTFRNITERGINVGSAYGVIDHNTFIRKVDASSPTLISISGDIKERNPANVNDSWVRPQDMGTSQAVYMEDNTLIHNINANGPYDAYEGARYVFRNNDVYGNNLGHHGYDSSYRGIVNFEIYNNHFTNSSPSGVLYKHGIVFEIRSGSGVFFNNVITKPANATNDVGGYDSFAVLRNYRSDPGLTENIGGGPCDGTNVNDGNSPDLVDVNSDGILQTAQGDKSSGYPCKDQVGRTSGFGPDGKQTLSPVYGWNNNFNGKIGGNLVVGEHVIVPNTRTATFHIKEGRDYFNGVARPGYSPYTYPHPMTVSGFTSDAGGPVGSIPIGNAAPQVVINIPPAPIVPNVLPIVPLPQTVLPPVAQLPQQPTVPANPLLPQTTFSIKSILPTGNKSNSVTTSSISKSNKTNMAPGSFVPIPESEEMVEIQHTETSFITLVKTIFSYIATRIVNGFYKIIGRDITSIIPATTQTAALSDLGSSLIAHYTFDEGSGTVVGDSRGSNNGTLVGGASWSSGKVGGAMSLNGTDSYVRLPDSSSLKSSSLTISAWFRARGHITDTMNIVSLHWNDVSISLSPYYGGRIGAFFNGSGSISAPLSSPTSWHHVVVTTDSSTASLYVDGALVATGPGSISWEVGSNAPSIGSNSEGNNYFFNGDIDDVKIYSKTLSSQDVAELYGGPIVSEPPPQNSPSANTPAQNQPVSNPVSNQNTPPPDVQGSNTPPYVSVDGLIIPNDRRIDWTVGVNVGVRGGIVRRSTVCKTLPAGTSAADIETALSQCPSGQVVKLGPGDFTLTKAVSVPSNITLRGSGVGVTKIHQGPSTFLQIAGVSSVSSPGKVTGGYVKGSTSLTISGTPSLASGDFIGVYQNDEPWVYSAHGGNSHIYSMYRVESVSGNQVTIWPPLVYGSTGYDPKYVRMSRFVENASIEDLSVYPGENTDYPIHIHSAYNSWVDNVSIHNIPNMGVFMYQSLGVTISHVDILKSVSKGDGYGVVLDNQTPGNTAIAIYNCIFDGLFHGIITSGQQGSVFAYNYTVNEHAQNGIQKQTSGYNASHNAEGMMSLWEGNFGNSLGSDGIHGGAAYQTVFRSRFTGEDSFFGLARGAMIGLAQGSYKWNIIGSVLGGSWVGTNQKYRYEYSASEWDAASSADHGGIYLLGYVGYKQPFDSNVASTILRYSNYDYWHKSVRNETTGISAPVPTSLAWSTKPAWFGDRPWPPFDPAHPETAVATAIPAGYRYAQGVDVAIDSSVSYIPQQAPLVTPPVVPQLPVIPPVAPVTPTTSLKDILPTPQVTPAPITPTPSFISRFIPSLGSSKKVSPYTVTANKTPGEFVPVPDVTEEEDVITRTELSLKETVKTIFSYITQRIVNGFHRVIGR